MRADRARGAKSNEPERSLIVLVCRLGTIAILDEGPLSLGVVSDVRDRRRRRRTRIEPLRGLDILAKTDVHLLEQVGFVVTRLYDVDAKLALVAVRFDHLDGPIE